MKHEKFAVSPCSIQTFSESIGTIYSPLQTIVIISESDFIMLNCIKNTTSCKRIAILTLAIMLGHTAIHGQINKIFKTGEIQTSNTIVKSYKGIANIIYTDHLSYGDRVWTNLITGTDPQFLYVPNGSNNYKSVTLPSYVLALNPRIMDFEILGDTLYFCGFEDLSFVISGPNPAIMPRYKGFIGYFNISDVFDVGASPQITVLEFHPQSLCVNRVSKMEVFRADNGLHIVCVGGSGGDNGTFSSRFVADVVNDSRTGQWWYYITSDAGEMFNDIAVTDNYAVSIAFKGTYDRIWIRVFNKPQQVAFNVNPQDDPSLFFPNGRVHPIHTYQASWTDDAIGEDYIHYDNPLIIHTNGDSIAFAFNNHYAPDGTVYGSTVKHLSVLDMLRINSPSTNPSVPGAIPIDLPDEEWPPLTPDINPTDPPGWGIDTPIITPFEECFGIPLQYNRMINQDITNVPITSAMVSGQWRIRSMAFDPDSRQIVLLQFIEYPAQWSGSYFTTPISVDRFDLASPDEVKRHFVDNQPFTSMTTNPRNRSFVVTGPESNESPYLTFGEYEYNHTEPCLQSKPILTFDPGSHLYSNMYGPNWSDFRFDRINPVADGYQNNPAFSIVRISPIVNSAYAEIICE